MKVESPRGLKTKGYITTPADAALHDRIPKRRGPISVMPGRPPADDYPLIDNIMKQFLPEFVGQSTQERWKRPIPHMEHESEIAPLIQLFSEFAPLLYPWLKQRVLPVVQTYDKKSRLGYPEFSISEEKTEIVLSYLDKIWRHDLSFMEGAYVTCNVRLQPDPPTKVREYTYLDDSLQAYTEEVDAEGRRDKKTGRLTSRTRLVFNFPLVNMATQIADTAIHHAILQFPFAHHRMNTWVRRTINAPARFFMDVKHFDRNVGPLIPIRAKQLGALYSDLTDQMLACPYLVPTEKWKPAFVKPDRSAGYMVQLGSGISAVAPVAKELFLILYTTFWMREKGTSFERALETMVKGTPELTIMNYGDDNIVTGEPGVVKRCVDYISEYLPIEEEDPPRFLGYNYDPQKGFFLSKDSYLKNFYLNERAPGSRFRQYPWMGIVLRRRVYAEQGDPTVTTEVVPFEREMWKEIGLTEDLLISFYQRDVEAAGSQAMLDYRVVLGKHYQLSTAERALLPDYGVLDVSYTSFALRKLLDGYGKG
jgi:hypothetical protein